MAGKKGDYFGISWIVSVILAIIPVTSWLLGALTRFTEGKIVAGILRLLLGWNIIWICGALTRFSEGKIVAGILRLLLGWGIIWLCDLICMLLNKHILRLINI